MDRLGVVECRLMDAQDRDESPTYKGLNSTASPENSGGPRAVDPSMLRPGKCSQDTHAAFQGEKLLKGTIAETGRLAQAFTHHGNCTVAAVGHSLFRPSAQLKPSMTFGSITKVRISYILLRRYTS